MEPTIKQIAHLHNVFQAWNESESEGFKKSYSDVEETECLNEAFYASWSVSRHTPNYSIFTAEFVTVLNFGLVWEVQLGLGLE